MSLGEALREARENLGDSIESLAGKLGVAKNSLNAYELGKTVPKTDFLNRFAQHTGIEYTELLRLALEATGVEGIRVIRVPPAGEDEEAAPGDFVKVPVYDVVAAAGDGALVIDEKQVAEIGFDGDWLRREIGVPVERLAIIRAVGNSIEPTIMNGDRLLVEIDAVGRLGTAPHVIRIHDELVVKRVGTRADGSLRIVSDNPVWPPEDWPPEQEGLQIIGRVRAIWRVT